MNVQECFDVFDTVITRRVGAATAVFLLVGAAAQRQGLLSIAPEEFRRQREQAERRGRQHAPGGEVTLAEIYAALAPALGLSPTVAAALQALEVETEQQLICAMPGAAELLAAARAHSPRLLFASEMYLPAEFLRARLAAHGGWRDGDRLYLSCEERVPKSDGRLFQRILAAEKLSPAALHHTGNHAQADFAGPRRLGIGATLRPEGNLNRYERRLEDFAAATRGLASFHAGGSRLARLSNPTEITALAAIRDVAAGVAAPVLVSYVAWVLRTARQRGIARLYFVARDGFLLLQLARLLGPALHPEAELRYLEGSRQAWHLPGIFSLGEAEFAWLFCPTDFLSVASVCQRIGLKPAEIAGDLAPAGFAAADWARNLSAPERLRLRTAMQRPAITALATARATAAREPLLAYLRQENVLTHEPCALVDVGWHGRAQDSLAKVIQAAGFRPPEGFYFGLNSTSGLANLGERHAWFFDRRTAAGCVDALPGIEPLMEVFCTADHGSTVGYTRGETRVEPVRGANRHALRAWGWPILQATVLSQGRHLADAIALSADEVALRAMSLAVLQLFWESPTPDEAQSWGQFPYEDDQSGAHSLPLARALGWQQVPALLLQGRRGSHRAEWWHGSLQLTPPARRTLLRGAHALRQAARLALRR
jgi:FMN phosphatase YigB (HAD superfamily)